MTFDHNAQLRVAYLALALLSSGCGESEPTASEVTSSPPKMLTPAPKGTVLSVGDLLPPLTVEGWINGPPPAAYGAEVRFVVVDVWAHWCPYCRLSAPELVRLFRKFDGRGVAFVSLTSMPRVSVETFVKEFSLPWPNGYGAHPTTVTALGVNSGQAIPGYEIAPTLYLVDRDRRVRWCDRQGRVRHTDPKEWGKQLEEAIEAELGKSSQDKP